MPNTPIVPPIYEQINTLGEGFPPSPTLPMGLAEFLNQMYAAAFTGGATGGGVVYQPGNPSPGEGVYTSFFDAYEAAKVKAGIVNITVDLIAYNAGVGTVEPADYDFENRIRLIAPLYPPNAQILTLPHGVTFSGFNMIFGAITFESTSNAPIITVTNEFALCLLALNCGLRASGTAPFISVGANGFLVLSTLAGNVISGASAVVEIADPTAALILGLALASVINANTITGASGTMIQQIFSTGIDLGNQPGFLGTTNVIRGTLSTYSSYTAAVPADWNGSAPDNVQTALDRIAAHVGPIP